jgi:transcriptional regulator with XRE-family HTH domain
LAQSIDPELLGQHLRRVRKKRELTLQEVSAETGISVATLSRVERDQAKTVNSDTLLRLSEWMETDLELLVNEPQSGSERTPDVVELHLRADKKLNKETATALANLFRTVYEQLTEQMKKR